MCVRAHACVCACTRMCVCACMLACVYACLSSLGINCPSSKTSLAPQLSRWTGPLPLSWVFGPLLTGLCTHTIRAIRHKLNPKWLPSQHYVIRPTSTLSVWWPAHWLWHDMQEFSWGMKTCKMHLQHKQFFLYKTENAQNSLTLHRFYKKQNKKIVGAYST